MSSPLPFFDAFEALLSKIAAELVLAEPKSSEGMVPMYSLLGDLADCCAAHAVLCESVAHVKAVLDRLLDNAQPFDSPTIDYLSEFSGWSQSAIYALRSGKEISVFAPFDAATSAPAAAATVVVSAQDELAAISQVTDVLMELKIDDDRELLGEFRTEALEHLEAIESNVLILEKDPHDADSMAALFRAFHTIKGVAGFLHLVPINRLAHEVESLLDLARNRKLTLSSRMITLILQARDTLSELVGQITAALERGKSPDKVIAVSELILQVKHAAAGQNGQSEEHLPPPALLSPGGFLKAETRKAENRAEARKESSETATIRVGTAKLDNLMDMIGELVIVQSQLAESAKTSAAENSALQRNTNQLQRITKDLQRNSMALRMIPIKQTFQKTGRLVRDLAASFGKKVEFITVGEETELDRNVVEQIGDPLVHMVRNSLDHGLEANSTERLAAGKPETGTIALKAYHMGSNIVIELSDDGRGLNTGRILEKAKEKGLVKPEAQPTMGEIHQMIFLPGFSTAEKITDVSGRGVGMDVVKRNIEKLHGAIEIESTLGHGTTFKIKLPLTLAIIDGLIVRVAEEKFILPTTSVKVALRPSPEQISTIGSKNEILVLRGKTIPIVRADRFFGIGGRTQANHHGILVVIETFGRPYALMVDEMIGKQEVVIKSLGSLLSSLKGIAGAAILGDGSISLILDPSSILASAS